MRISYWSSDVCSSDLLGPPFIRNRRKRQFQRHPAQNRHFFGQSGLLERRQRHTARDPPAAKLLAGIVVRSEEHTSELQSLMRFSYAVFCLYKYKQYCFYSFVCAIATMFVGRHNAASDLIQGAAIET